MSHANAALTPRARLRLARLIVEGGWSPARAAERYDVSWRTANKWADRYRAEGEAGIPRRPPICTGPRRCFHRRCTILRTVGRGVRAGLWCGRDERSCIPAGPSAR